MNKRESNMAFFFLFIALCILVIGTVVAGAGWFMKTKYNPDEKPKAESPL